MNEQTATPVAEARKKFVKLNQEQVVKLADWLRNEKIVAWLNQTGPTFRLVATEAGKALGFDITPEALIRMAKTINLIWKPAAKAKEVKLTKDEQITELKAENEQLNARIKELEDHIEQLQSGATAPATLLAGDQSSAGNVIEMVAPVAEPPVAEIVTEAAAVPPPPFLQ